MNIKLSNSTKPMPVFDEQCCDNCYYFTNEDIDGTGLCHSFKEIHFCGDTECEHWEGKEETE